MVGAATGGNMGKTQQLASLRSTLDRVASLPLSQPAASQYRAASQIASPVAPQVSAAEYREAATNRQVSQAQSPYGYNPAAGVGVTGSSRGGVFTPGTPVANVPAGATLGGGDTPGRVDYTAEYTSPAAVESRKYNMQKRYGLRPDGSSATPLDRASLIASRTDLSDEQKAAFLNNAYTRRMQGGMAVPAGVQQAIASGDATQLASYNPGNDGRFTMRTLDDLKENPQGNPYQLASLRTAQPAPEAPAVDYRQAASQQVASQGGGDQGFSPQAIRQQLALQDRLQRRERINNRYAPSAELQIGRAAAAGNPYAMETFRRLQENSQDNATRMQQSQAQLMAEQARAQAMGQQYGARNANDAARVANEGKLIEAQVAQIQDQIKRGGSGADLKGLQDRLAALQLGQQVADLERTVNATDQQKYDQIRLKYKADGASDADASMAATQEMRAQGIPFDPPEVDLLPNPGTEEGAQPIDVANDFLGRLHQTFRYGEEGGKELSPEEFSRAVSNSGLTKPDLRALLRELEPRRPKFKGGPAAHLSDWSPNKIGGERVEREIALLRNELGLDPLPPLPERELPAPGNQGPALLGGGQTFYPVGY